MFAGSDEFGFGLEAEYLLLEADTYRPLWYKDLPFKKLDSLISQIPLFDIPLCGLKPNLPHSTISPYIIEGYHVFDSLHRSTEILPKGLEIRTPTATSLDSCLDYFFLLHQRLESALLQNGYRIVPLSHHPFHTHFEGPQDQRTPQFWKWAQQAMVTYGPDINISLPSDYFKESGFDLPDFERKLNYYLPALTTLSLASPFYDGKLWEIDSKWGQSARTYFRSQVAPLLKFHPDQGNRFEFKPFEMSNRVRDFRNYFLICLSLLLDKNLQGRASDEEARRFSQEIAINGWNVQNAIARSTEVLLRSAQLLPTWGFDATPLLDFIRRIDCRSNPALELQSLYFECGTIESTLVHRTELIPEFTRQADGKINSATPLRLFLNEGPSDILEAKEQYA